MPLPLLTTLFWNAIFRGIPDLRVKLVICPFRVCLGYFGSVSVVLGRFGSTGTFWVIFRHFGFFQNHPAPNHIYEAMVDRMVLGEDRLMAGESTFDRSVNCPSGGCAIPIQLSHIWGYGCWCNFGDELLEGSYHPVNAYDEVCRNLQQCLKCAIKDAQTGDYECDPKTKEYRECG